MPQLRPIGHVRLYYRANLLRIVQTFSRRSDFVPYEYLIRSPVDLRESLTYQRKACNSVRFWGVIIAWLLSARLSVPSIDSSIDIQLTDYQYLLLAAARMHAAERHNNCSREFGVQFLAHPVVKGVQRVAQ